MIIQGLVHDVHNFTFGINHSLFSKASNKLDKLFKLGMIAPLQNVRVKVFVKHMQILRRKLSDQLDQLNTHSKVELVNIDLLVIQ